jgi:hypothetical protein
MLANKPASRASTLFRLTYLEVHPGDGRHSESNSSARQLRESTTLQKDARERF